MEQVGLNMFDEQLYFIKVVFWYLLALDLLILLSTAVSANYTTWDVLNIHKSHLLRIFGLL